MRHGKTRYTDPFPDLTPEGITQVEDFARGRFLPWMEHTKTAPSELEIIASPAPRAHGTAWVMANAIGYAPERIVVEEELRPMQWRDKERALKALSAFRGRPYVDYETEPVFRDREIFETPDEVRERWYAYFSKLLMARVYATRQSRRLLLVSHYELLCNIARDYFGVVPSASTALRHAEVIVLRVHQQSHGTQRQFKIDGTFRHVYLLQKTYDADSQKFL